KGFEPLLLVPIGFGVLIGNIPYDAHQLSLSVYDGPASETKLLYFTRDREVLLADGRVVPPLTFIYAADPHFRAPREGTIARGTPPWRLSWPEGEEAPATLDPPVGLSEAKSLVADGFAVMVHAEEFLSVSSSLVEAPGVLALPRG